MINIIKGKNKHTSLSAFLNISIRCFNIVWQSDWRNLVLSLSESTAIKHWISRIGIQSVFRHIMDIINKYIKRNKLLKNINLNYLKQKYSVYYNLIVPLTELQLQLLTTNWSGKRKHRFIWINLIKNYCT